MTRPLRIEYPGAWYHVMSRGNSGQDIFLSDKDRASFLEGLRESSEIHGVRVAAFVLMGNHFHLIVQTPQANLSEYMRHFLVTYTVRFNRRWSRTGHLFQGRFKSLLVEQDEYLVPLSRYIHLNPIRTKQLENRDPATRERYLLGYRWSSLPGYCRLGKRLDMIDYRWLLESYFDGDTRTGRAGYRRYVCEGITGEIDNPFDRVVHQSIIGTDAFVDRIRGWIRGGPEREVPALRRVRRPLGMEEIVKEIAASQGVEPQDLLSRKARLLRQIAMELCYRYSTVPQREIGKLFRVDYSTVSQNRARLRAKLETDAKHKRLFEQLEQRILALSK